MSAWTNNVICRQWWQPGHYARECENERGPHFPGCSYYYLPAGGKLSYLETANVSATEQYWVAKPSTFDYSVRYHPGHTDKNADALPRQPMVVYHPGPLVLSAFLSRWRGRSPEASSAR